MVVKSHLPRSQGNTCAIAGQPLEHILVPTVGTGYSKNAVEVASTIAAQTKAIITIVNVINRPQVEYVLFDQQRLNQVQEIALNLVEQQAAIGPSLGAEVKTLVLTGTSPERSILSFADSQNVDLIVLGSNVRMVTDSQALIAFIKLYKALLDRRDNLVNLCQLWLILGHEYDSQPLAPLSFSLSLEPSENV